MNSSASRLGLTNALLMAAFPSLKDADTVSCSGVASAIAGRTLPPFSPELTSVAVTLLSSGTSAIFGNEEFLSNIVEDCAGHVTFGDGERGKIIGRGTLNAEDPNSPMDNENSPGIEADVDGVEDDADHGEREWSPFIAGALGARTETTLPL
nr:hypothetical protein Iba_chr04dCG14890 [Ipomoea batatas]